MSVGRVMRGDAMAGKSLPEQNSRTALTLGDGSPARVWPQALAAGVATLGALSVGTCLGWMSPALPLLQDKTSHFLVSDEEASWIAVLVAALPWLPESPVWLLGRGRDAEAARALRWFRGGADPEFELLRLRATLNTAPSRASAASVDALRRGGLRRALAPDRAGARALLVVLGLMAVQQLSGINAVLATASGAALSDRAGRRPLLLLSAAVMALCLGTLGCCYQWPHALPGWLPLLTVALFLVVFSLGFGPVPWLMMGELLAPEVKASASALAVTLNWMLAFGVTKTFGPLLRLLGSPGTFFAFSAICVVGALFVLLLVPETKGKDPTTIQAELAGRHGHQRVGTKPV
ncbi:Facilitated trehalose transporter Tret1 [Gryllus bimaculatus]|nr:Facilitated trehalose transporter Tret1 [Gryllus bimaculatus]